MRLRSPTMRLTVAVIAAALMLAGCTNSPAPTSQQPPTTASTQPGTTGPGLASKPNIIFVLTDDLSTDLVRFMPQVQRMRQQGARFTDYSVSDTLCCPSRASILTGRFPHNTGIFTNSGDDGGFGEFYERGGERSTIGTQLQRAGYRTGFMGKYLNGYQPARAVDGQSGYVAPGWDTWAVAGNGYREYDYQLNKDGKLVDYGSDPHDYLTDVLSRKGTSFIRSNAKVGKPFYLQINTFSPHGPATPAARHQDEFTETAAPRGPAFGESEMSDKPGWLRDQPSLNGKEQKKINTLYRKRVRSMQSVDEMLASLRTALQETGQADNTYIVFSSDNGFHMGQHRLMPGKQTAFDTDVTVPLVVTGPGVPAGHIIDAPVQNIDLRPTFADLAHAATPADVDGASLAALLHGQDPTWRTVSLIEHHGPNNTQQDPDRQSKKRGNPPTYSAIRTPDGTYVEYRNGDREYYDQRSDPDQLTNTYPALTAQQRRWLQTTLADLRACRGGQACFAAGQPG